jgi:hypothetical protein
MEMADFLVLQMTMPHQVMVQIKTDRLPPALPEVSFDKYDKYLLVIDRNGYDQETENTFELPMAFTKIDAEW